MTNYLNNLSDVIGNFSLDEARYDRVQISITGLSASGETNTPELIRRAIGQPPDVLPSERRPVDADRCEIPFLGSLQGGNYRRRSALFRRPRTREHNFPRGTPLIGGKINVTVRNDPSHGPSEFSLSADLSLNPTRFIRHSLEREMIARSRRQGFEFEEYHFLSQRRGRHAGGETILDENDNCLIGAVGLVALPGLFQEAAEAYFRQAVGFVLQRVHRHAGEQYEINGNPTFNLKTVETYWERRSDDPIRLVFQIAQALFARNYRATAVLHQPRVSISRIGNAIAVDVPVRTGARAKIYAKTNKRIRFEITHDLTKDCTFFTDIPAGRHTAADMQTIQSMITGCAVDACGRLNGLIRPGMHTSSDFAWELIAEIVRAMDAAPGSAERKSSLFAVLMSTGGATTNTPMFRPTVEHLVRQGILEQSGHAMRTLTPRYIPILELTGQQTPFGDASDRSGYDTRSSE